MNKKTIITTSVIAVLTVFSIQCGEQATPKAYSLTGVFTNVKGEVTVNQKKVRVGTRVTKNSTIKVAKKSLAVIQFSTGALITLKAKAKLEIQKLAMNDANIPEISLKQTAGSSFSRINKGKAQYTMNTPTAVAGVRGTSFSVSVSKDKKTKIRLLKGKVVVKSKKKSAKKKEVVLKTGQKIAVDNKGLKRVNKLKKTEKESLKALDQVVFMPKEIINQTDDKKLRTEVRKAATVVIPERVDSVVTSSKLIISKKEAMEEAKIREEEAAASAKEEESISVDDDGEEEPEKLTLADLRKKYKKISEVTTRSGQKYVGHFVQTGRNFVIDTVDGKVTIASSQVKKVIELYK